jgi:L-cysteine desulfidase
MHLLKEVFAHEVFPAFGCTEPISVAYAAAEAAFTLAEPVRTMQIMVDPGVYKNGKSVIVPNTGGERGNVIAGVIGALLARPDLRMEILKDATSEIVSKARDFVHEQRVTIDYDAAQKDLYIRVSVQGISHTADVVIAGSHTNIVRLEKDGKVIKSTVSVPGQKTEPAYRKALRQLTIMDLIALAEQADADDFEYIRRGIEMNLALVDEGLKLQKVGYQIAELLKSTGSADNHVVRSKVLTAAASDARMAGLPYPVMSSGGAGNQGVVAILVAHAVGKALNIDETLVLKSIALSHLVNAYVKCFTGDLSVICGCAIAAGMGAAVAMVYQQCGADMHRIGLAVNTVACDLGGIFCDGAKEGCAIKVAGATDASIRAAFMAIKGFGIPACEGIAGLSPEKTIQNIGRIGNEGMTEVNRLILELMRDNDQVNG